MNYYDISPLITEKFAVFPGDIPFSLSKHSDISQGDSCTLSSIKTTLHIGSHADAPSHYSIKGQDISQRSLNYYFGNCQVIDFTEHKSNVIDIEDFKSVRIDANRILIKTNSWDSFNTWEENLVSLSPQLINYLGKKKVILVGIDTPSIDNSGAKNLVSHKAIYENNMAILECLLLKKVPAGLYSIIALPLLISQGDSSPVRAVLLPHDSLPELINE